MDGDAPPSAAPSAAGPPPADRFVSLFLADVSAFRRRRDRPAPPPAPPPPAPPPRAKRRPPPAALAGWVLRLTQRPRARPAPRRPRGRALTAEQAEALCARQHGLWVARRDRLAAERAGAAQREGAELEKWRSASHMGARTRALAERRLAAAIDAALPAHPAQVPEARVVAAFRALGILAGAEDPGRSPLLRAYLDGARGADGSFAVARLRAELAARPRSAFQHFARRSVFVRLGGRKGAE
jgi:hypothetical protein